MDAVLVALGVMLPLIVALAWAVWFLIAKCQQVRRRDIRTRHAFRGQGEAVTVAELLEEAREQGESVRLNWPEGDLDGAKWRG